MRIILSTVAIAAASIGLAIVALPSKPVAPVNAIVTPAGKPQVLPVGLAAYATRIKAAAMANAIPSSLLAAVLKRESGFDPAALSPAGAHGLAQFMPKTALAYGVDTADPHASIDGCARMLRDMLDATDGNVGLALASYNWGQGNVRRWKAQGAKPAKMPKETRNYVLSITGVGITVWTGKAKSIGDLVANVAPSDFQSDMRRALVK